MNWRKDYGWVIVFLIGLIVIGFVIGWGLKKCPTCPPITERVYIGYHIGENDTLNIVIDSIRIINVIDVR